VANDELFDLFLVVEAIFALIAPSGGIATHAMDLWVAIGSVGRLLCIDLGRRSRLLAGVVIIWRLIHYRS
jgi:hypothetical protein